MMSAFRKIKGMFLNIPFVAKPYNKLRLYKQYKIELQLIKGTHRNRNKHKSIIHFSLNRAATQYVKSLLRKCVTEQGMFPVSLHEYAYNSDFPYLDSLSELEMKKYSHIFRPNGYLYSVFGGMILGIPRLEDYHVVLMIRNPLDILTSDYYALAYSSGKPSAHGNKYAAFATRRVYARELDIDNYVIGECEKLAKMYQKYIDLLLDRYPNVYLTKYEEMTSDFYDWLDRLLSYCNLNITSHLRRSLLKEAELIRPKKENIYQHIRQGKPGDHKRKLKNETIEYLNFELQCILEKFDYI